MHEDELEERRADPVDLKEVMQAFGVSAWQNLGQVESSAAGPLSLLVEIEGKPYVLKALPDGLAGGSSEAINHRYAFGSYLRAAGIPVPPVRLTAQGEPAAMIGEDAFELQEWADGEIYSSADPHSLAWVAAAGTMLGQLHQASRRYQGPQYRWPAEVQAGGLVQGWLNFARAKAEQSEVYAITAAISHLVEQWEAVLPAAMMAIGSVRGLPEFHIHGDYHPLHLRFDAQRVSAVLGLEASRWEKRIIELACAVFYFGALAWRSATRLTRPLVKRGFDPERTRHFLSAYGAVYPPVPGEAALLVDALTLMAPIISVNGPLEDIFFTPGNIGEEDLLVEGLLERLSWAASLPAWLGRVRRSFAEMWQ